MKTNYYVLIAFIFLLINMNGQNNEIFDEFKSGNSVSEIMGVIQSSADWQMEQPLFKHRVNWVNATFFTALVQFAPFANNPKYYEYIKEYGELNEWQMGPERFFADDYCIGDVFARLSKVYDNKKMIEPWQFLADEIIERPHTESLEFKNENHFREWSWCDALYMGPPSLASLGAVTGETKYFDIMDKLWWKTTDYLYDQDEHLYFRDSRFFDKREPNGQKVFWSRGNGWVMSGLARVLQMLPKDYPQKQRYEKLFKEMAAKIASIQSPDGYWRASLLDPEVLPSKETSGTAFYCYALTWGINNGLLEKSEYLPVVLKAWNALKQATHPNGMLGFVQQIAAGPYDVEFDHTQAYGTAGLILSGIELIKLRLSHPTSGMVLWADNPFQIDRKSETIEVDWVDIKAKLKDVSPKEIIVKNVLLNHEIPHQITYDIHGGYDKLIFQSDFSFHSKTAFTISKGIANAYNQKTYGRFVPERKDDFAWENDNIGFRVYGPALQKSGEVSSGIDVWAKRSRWLIIDKWYKEGDYHTDHGEGLDFYKVGSTLGAGGAAPVSNNRLWYSENFASYKIINNGPIRTTFVLEYAPWNVNGQKVGLTKTISLDAGSFLNKYELDYTFDTDQLHIAVGIQKRKEPGQVYFSEYNKVMSYWEPGQGENGVIGIGTVVNKPIAIGIKENHLISKTVIEKKESLIYYGGATWDKKAKNAITTFRDWNTYLDNYSLRLVSPLKLSIN